MDYLTTHTSLSPIRRGFVPCFVNYKKKGALDSQPQAIKFTSCLPMVGGSLRVLRLLPRTQTGRHDIAEILLKVALKHKNSNQTKHIQDSRNALLYLKHILLLESKWIRHTYFNFIEMYPKKCILHRCIG